MMKNPLPDVRSLTSESGKGNEQLKVMNVSVFCRSHIRNFFEKSGKVRVVSVSDIISYRIDRKIGGSQQILGNIDSFVDNVIFEGETGFFFEQFGQGKRYR